MCEHQVSGLFGPFATPMFWIGMSNDVKQLADNCDVCQQTKPCNSEEPLQQHVEGRTPWEKCGVDLFEFNQKYYLVTVDYFSNFLKLTFSPLRPQVL